MNRPAESSSRQEKVKPKKVDRLVNLLQDSKAKFSKAARAARPRPTEINMIGRHINPWTTRVHDSSSSSSDSNSSNSSSSSDSSSSNSNSSDSSSSSSDSSDSSSSSSNSSSSSDNSSSNSDSSNSSSSSSNSSDSSSSSSSSSDSSDSSDSSSSSSNENNTPHRRATELARPEASLLKTPSRPAPAYTFPLTAQARARSRLGYTGAKSALPKLPPWVTSPLGGGTAGTGIRPTGIRPTGIRPPGYGLNSVHNNNNNVHGNAAADINKPAAAPAIVVPAVVRPPPYIFHARDRFLETNLAATFDRSRTSPHPPPPAYGVARPPIALLDLGDTTTSSNRDIRGLRRPRSIRSVDSVDWMIDLERGTRLRNERRAEGRPRESGKVVFGFLFLLFLIGTIVAADYLTKRV